MTHVRKRIVFLRLRGLPTPHLVAIEVDVPGLAGVVRLVVVLPKLLIAEIVQLPQGTV